MLQKFRLLTLPMGVLCWRELVRFSRQKSRWLSAVGQGVAFWILMGAGLKGSFHFPGTAELTSMQYFFPGTLLLVILFSSLFSTFSVIDDRNVGFLQSVLVSPTPTASIVLGKALGGALLALLQASFLLSAAPLAGYAFQFSTFFHLLFLLFVISCGMTSLGFAIAWRVESTQGFHAIMTLFFFPLWILSGALFPLAGASTWLRRIMEWNPMSYQLSAIQTALSAPLSSSTSSFSSHGASGLALGVTLLFTLCAVGIAILLTRRALR